MGAGVGVFEAAAPPASGVTTLLEGPAPPAGGPALSLDLVACGSLPGTRATPLTKLWLPERCGCSRAAPWVLSAMGPLPARAGTGSPALDELTAVVVFFLGSMMMKNC